MIKTYVGLEEVVTEVEINSLCDKMYRHTVGHYNSQEGIGCTCDLAKKNLLIWRFLIKRGNKHYSTNAFVLMTYNSFHRSYLQVAMYDGGTDKTPFSSYCIR